MILKQEWRSIFHFRSLNRANPVECLHIFKSDGKDNESEGFSNLRCIGELCFFRAGEVMPTSPAEGKVRCLILRPLE